METIIILTLLTVAVLGALTLGVVSVITANKNRSKFQELNTSIEEIHRRIHSENDEIYREFEKINSKIDSRSDKLYDSISSEIEAIHRSIDENRRESEDDLKLFIQKWRDSDEYQNLFNNTPTGREQSNPVKTY